MSISQIQYNRKKEEFIKILIQKGIEPNNFELNKMLSEYFDNHILGMPYYSPIKQTPYEQSNKEDYNHNFETFKEDIETAYEANISINNKAVAMQEYYDVEKIKVRNALAKLNLRIENILDGLKYADAIQQYVEVFDDLYGVEYYGDTKRNIPYTTSFIDLLQKKVYTDKTNNKLNKISLLNAKISISGLSDFVETETKGTIDNILNDVNNEIYILNGRTTINKEKSITIDIDIGSLIDVNTIRFSCTSTKKVNCDLLLSDDGANFYSVYSINGLDNIEWNFNKKTIQYIKIIYKKSEPDGVVIDNNMEIYEYYFILKNISIMLDEYQNKSIFVSKPITFNNLTSSIKLDVNDMIFDNTRIDYFIGFDNNSNKIGWDSIINHKEHGLFMFEKRHKILNYHVDDFGTIGEILQLYKLYKLPDGVNRNSIKLTPGYNMWSVKKYNRKNGDSNEDGFSLISGDFSDHVSKCNLTEIFMDCENYNDFILETNTLYIFTQYISLQSAQNIYDTFIKVTDNNYNEINNAEIRLFVNGYETTSIDNNKYSFYFKKGVSKIQIAIYISDTTASTKRLYHNLNLKSLTNDVFAYPPMKYTSNTILDKTIGENYNYYTIKDGYIYVKCNPLDMIKSDMNDMGYFISYYMLKEDMRNYFDDDKLTFRIMAILDSNNKNISPQILNYRITGK